MRFDDFFFFFFFFLHASAKKKTKRVKVSNFALYVLFSSDIMAVKGLMTYYFSCQAPATWNQLPVSVRHAASVSFFESSLKTFLFSKTFSSVPWP